MFVFEEHNSTAIKDVIRNYNSNLDLAIPSIRQDAELLLNQANADNFRIVCNLTNGRTDPNVIQRLLSDGRFKIKYNSALNGRIFIGDNMAVISSANLIRSALSFNALVEEKSIETGLIISLLGAVDTQESAAELNRIKIWFEDLFHASADITEGSINLSREMWEYRNRLDNYMRKKFTLLRKLREAPGYFRFKRIFLVFHSEKKLQPLRQFGQFAINEPGFEHNSTAAYENWTDLPNNAYFLDFLVDSESRSSRFLGIWRSPGSSRIRPFPGGQLFLCAKAKTVCGDYLSKEEQTLIEEKAYYLLTNQRVGIGDSSAKYIPLLDARYFLIP